MAPGPALAFILAGADTSIGAISDLTWADRTFDLFPWSFALVPVGIVFFFVSLHVTNALASVSGRWAHYSLGDTFPSVSKTGATSIVVSASTLM